MIELRQTWTTVNEKIFGLVTRQQHTHSESETNKTKYDWITEIEKCTRYTQNSSGYWRHSRLPSLCKEKKKGWLLNERPMRPCYTIFACTIHLWRTGCMFLLPISCPAVTNFVRMFSSPDSPGNLQRIDGRWWKARMLQLSMRLHLHRKRRSPPPNRRLVPGHPAHHPAAVGQLMPTRFCSQMWVQAVLRPLLIFWVLSTTKPLLFHLLDLPKLDGCGLKQLSFISMVLHPS